jgi:Type III restriction enzyme, res subunit
VTTPRITCVDALMGAGKTTLAIKMMDELATSFENVFEDGKHRFLYITPFIAEVDRVEAALAQHSGRKIAFVPKPVAGRKLNHLNEMILDGRNVVATHALFAEVNEETYSALEEFQYTLLIDEVADWVERYPISATDLKVLYDQRILSTDPSTRRMIWMDPEGGYRGRFEDLRSLCQQGKAVASRFGVNGVPTVLLWQFPIEMLARFKEVYIFTHLLREVTWARISGCTTLR